MEKVHREIRLSVIENNSKVSGNFTIEDIVQAISQGQGCGVDFNSKIEKIRNGCPDKENIKRSLPGFTPTGIFEESRKGENLVKYSGIIQVDLDYLSEEEISRITAKLPTVSKVYVAFRSVSGKGIKILIQTNASQVNHTLAFDQVCNWIDDCLNVECDRAVKSIAQQCYFSYDPEVYFNPLADVFEVVENAIMEPAVLQLGIEYADLFRKAKEIVSDKYTFEKGSRNVFIYNLASVCHKFGVPEEDAVDLIDSNYCFEEQDNNRELIQATKSAYRNEGFGEWSQNISPANVKFRETVYEFLPPFLRELCGLFDEEHERDVFLLGSLTVLSGCFPTIWGQYGKYRTFANLYTFILAPAASGKGVISFSKLLGKALNDQTYEQSKNASRSCLEDVDNSECPPVSSLMISGNNSSSGIIRDLKNNNGLGIICESEADVVGNNFKREWGNFSPTLRQAYHHESITYSRKGLQENIRIEDPKLSMCLTSTPRQIYSVMRSPEDGLFSRFMYYSYNPKLRWISPRPTGSSSIELLESSLNQAAQMVLRLHNLLVDRSIEFRLTDEHWDKLDKFFSEQLAHYSNKGYEGFQSSIKRMGLITYKIAMVLCIARNINSIEQEVLICSDNDFDNALDISAYLLVHSFSVHQRLVGPGVHFSQNDKNRVIQIHSTLPHTFRATDFISASQSLGISKRTAYRILKNWAGELWVKNKNGGYQKIALLPSGSVAV